MSVHDFKRLLLFEEKLGKADITDNRDLLTD